jgi:hypothetical protein
MRKSVIRVGVSLAYVTLLLVARPASAQTAAAQSEDEALRTDVLKLMDVTGASKIGMQFASFIAGPLRQALKQSQPDIPDRVWEIAKETIDAELTKAFEGPDGLMPQVVSLYMKYFTHDDIRAMLAFYETPVGKKTIQVTPMLLQDSAIVAQQWAAKQMPAIIAAVQTRLKAEGFIK